MASKRVAGATKAMCCKVKRCCNVCGTILFRFVAGAAITYGVYKTMVAAQAHALDTRTVYIKPKPKKPEYKDPTRGNWPRSYADYPPTPQPSVVSAEKVHSLFLWIKVQPKCDYKSVVSAMARLPNYVTNVTGPITQGNQCEILAGVGFGPELYKHGAGGAPKPYSNDRHHLIKRKPPKVGDSVGGDVLIHAKSNNLQGLIDLSTIVINSLPTGTLRWSEAIFATDPLQEGLEYKQEGRYPLGIVNHKFKTGDVPKYLARFSSPDDRLDLRLEAAVDPITGGSYVIAQKWVHNFHLVDTGGNMHINEFIYRAFDDCVAKERKLPGSTLAEDFARIEEKDWKDKAYVECIELRRRHPELNIVCKPGGKPVLPTAFRMLRQSMPFTKEDSNGLFFLAYASSPLDPELFVQRLAASCGSTPITPCLHNDRPDPCPPSPDKISEDGATPHPGAPTITACNVPGCPNEKSRSGQCDDIYRWASNERTAVWYFPGRDELAYLE